MSYTEMHLAKDSVLWSAHEELATLIRSFLDTGPVLIILEEEIGFIVQRREMITDGNKKP